MTDQDGPLDLFVYIRKVVDRFQAKLFGEKKMWNFTCPACFSVWVTFGTTFALQPADPVSFFMLWMASAAAVIFLGSIKEKIES